MRESIFSGLFGPIEYHSQRAFERDLPAATTERPVLIQEVRSSRRVVSITASLLTAAPGSALACPVCALVGTSNNTWAYQAMSAMLALLPLAMVGAIVWWLTRLAARADTERQSATQHASDRAPVGGAETYSVVARSD
jgi:Na+/melibiose symporter-like transporter